MVQKRKNWPIIVVVIAAVMVVLSLGVYFAYPYLQDKVAGNSKDSAITALKTEGQKIKDELTEQLSLVKSEALSDKKEYKGTLKLDKLAADGKDYTSDVKGLTAEYNIQVDTLSKKSGVLAELKKSDTQDKISVTAYADENKVYIKSPEIYSYPVMMSVKQIYNMLGMSDYYGEGQYILSQLDSKTVSEYADVFEKIADYINVSYNAVIEGADYTELGKENIDTAAGQINVKKYKVKITSEHLAEELENVVNAIYSDAKLAGYMSLFNAATGLSRSSLLTKLQKCVLFAGPYEAEVYVNNDNRIVKFYMVSADKTADITVEHLGSNEPWEDTKLTVNSSKNADIAQSFDSKLVVECSGTTDKKISVSAEARKDNDNVKLLTESVLSDSGKNGNINKFIFTANVSGTDIDVEGSISYSIGTYTNMDVTENLFRNAVDAGNIINMLRK